MINIDALDQTQLKNDPYTYIVVKDFIKRDAIGAIIKDYPAIHKPGSFPLASLHYGSAFQQLLDKLKSPEFQQAVEKKFSIDLTGKPAMITIRGMCSGKDGKIHTDSTSKIISLLLYMNDDDWDNTGGRLRVLRSENIEDAAEEIPPTAGTLLMFRRSDHSWHGHKPYRGMRRVIQLNWVDDQKFVDRNYQRHSLSSILKNLNPFHRTNAY